MTEAAEKDVVLKVGQEFPLPSVPADWRKIDEVQVFGEIKHLDGVCDFLRLAKAHGVTLHGMDSNAVAYLHNDTTVDSARG
ncbi:MAG: hypothetical protein UX77_C0021G0017 [Parcubacteria group bacterium GW2011_GWA1_47_11]|nr:MAG: hypothetical protein UX77_C0021G0017 [Parcubacteria group bacterium GW2011_GWA1_47_11]